MHNDILLDDRPYTQQWPHKIIMVIKKFLLPNDVVALITHYSCVCDDAGVNKPTALAGV